ncbi:MAG: hydroxyphenylacetyl-CoA thioesterase PaaI [Gammaproteobacteria bacterium]|nr:hydroxyphenylacetyl-CoA thioesterase PaaI [Gammaproteobacteria bacterium]
MYIEQIMSRNVDCVTAEMKLSHASHLMDEKGRQYLPVVDDANHLQGLLTKTEIDQAEPSAITTLSVGEVNYLMSTLRVANVMLKEVITCSPDTLIEEAGQLMRQKKISSLPVVANDKLVGIITDADILDFFLDITGCTLKESARIAIHLSDDRGTLGQLLDDITALGGYIATVVSPYSKDSSGKRTVILRFQADDPQAVDNGLRDKGYEFITERLPLEAPSTDKTAPGKPRSDKLPEPAEIGTWMHKNDHFINLLGIELVDIQPGFARVEMLVREDMLNAVDIIQGGATFTLADFAFAAASNSHGTVAVGLNVQINYSTPAFEGERLIATAREVNLGKRTGIYSVEVRKSDDTLVAHFTGTVFRRDDSLQQWIGRD